MKIKALKKDIKHKIYIASVLLLLLHYVPLEEKGEGELCKPT